MTERDETERLCDAAWYAVKAIRRESHPADGCAASDTVHALTTHARSLRDEVVALRAEKIAAGEFDRDRYARLYHDECEAGRVIRKDRDALRALPVLRTCGECGHRNDSLCDHPDADAGTKRVGGLAVSEPRNVRRNAPPPSWCPLRGQR